MTKNDKSSKKSAVYSSTGGNTTLFNKQNYKLMLIGLIVMTLGFVLMAGGRSNNPNVFDAKAIYSFTRITLAPILIVGGLVIEIFAIMHKSKDKPAA
jgi:hypothetical protein